MSTNCLVTKLKAIVNNDNLPYLGFMLVEAVANDRWTTYTRTFGIMSSVAQSVKSVDGEAIFTTDSSKLNSDNPSDFTNELAIPQRGPATLNDQQVFTFYVKPGAHKFVLTNKYKIVQLGYMDSQGTGQDFKFNIGELKYSDDIKVLYFPSNDAIYGNVSDLSGKSLAVLTISGHNSPLVCTTEDINNINWAGSYPYIYLKDTCGINVSKVKGNLSSIYNKNLGIFSVNLLSNSNELTGSIADFANNNDIIRLTIMKTGVTGSINTISRSKLNTIAVGNTAITGNILKFVASQVGATTPRTSGSIRNSGWWGENIKWGTSSFNVGADTVRWRPSSTGSQTAGAVTDVMSTLKNAAVAIDASGNIVAEITPW